MTGVEEEEEEGRTTSPPAYEGTRTTSPEGYEGTRPTSPAAVDETLEPDSEDELFINEGPSLDDEDSFPGAGEDYSANYDDNSTFLDDDETTYGSPGLREAFGEGFGATAELDNNSVDLEPSRAGSADQSRRNKRKNFRPRNIVYSTNDSDGEEKGRTADNSPMDLSVAGGRPNLDSDSESETSGAGAGAKPKPGGLSVVRPEILFGRKTPTSTSIPTSNQSPLSLLSHLSGMSGGLNPFKTEDARTNTMKDAFREVLKLYGMSSEMADTITNNTGHLGEDHVLL